MQHARMIIPPYLTEGSHIISNKFSPLKFDYMINDFHLNWWAITKNNLFQASSSPV